MIALGLYIATIFAANWAFVTFGVVPVGFGLMAPAAVYFVGAALTIRDFLGTRNRVLVGIAIGALLTVFLSGPLAIASGAAFAFSELADWQVYGRLRMRGWAWAVVGSNAVGLILDSIIFLTLAFGSLDFLAGQVVGKAEMTLLALPVIAVLRRFYRGARFTHVRGDRYVELR